MARVFKVKTGRKTVYPLLLKDAENMLILAQKKRDEASSKEFAREYDRDFMMIKLGVNTAFRIEDLVQLKVDDNLKRGYLYIREFKTSKEQSFEVNDKLKNDINGFIKRNNLYDGEYLFQSRKGNNLPITRQAAWMRIKKYVKELNINYPTGCHSMRKCFAKAYYDKTGDIIGLKEMLNHSSERVTLLYICYNQATKNKNRKGIYI